VILTVDDTAGPALTLATHSVAFKDVAKYLVYSGGTPGTSFTTQGSSIKMFLRAADSSDATVRSYNKNGTFTWISGGSALASNISPVSFVDGIAELNITDSVLETVQFRVEQQDTPSINTGGTNISVQFQSSDSTPPQIVRVEVDTPYVVHVYFNEDVDSVTGGEKTNYYITNSNFGDAQLYKVCWYGDHVTLNFSTDVATIAGVSSLEVCVRNVKDMDNNAIIGNLFSDSVIIPTIDFHGGAGASNDWFEVKLSDNTPSINQTVHVTVYHKNICGYLKGTNNTNKNNTVGTATVYYGGYGTPGIFGTITNNVDMSSGQADFDIEISPSAAGQTISISVSDGTVNTPSPASMSVQ
jgi:hypothetical protein